MTDQTITPREPFSSSKFLADWAIRQSKTQRGTWQGLSSETIPAYTQLIP